MIHMHTGTYVYTNTYDHTGAYTIAHIFPHTKAHHYRGAISWPGVMVLALNPSI